VKLAYVDLCGFRGYRKRVRIDFADDFTIIDGRNGVGKSTIFDAVEYALTGHLSKYNDAKADGETVADYIWWTGKGPAPADRYVEAGFRDQDGVISIRRTEFQSPDDATLIKMAARLCDFDLAPRAPLSQLCYTSIIRDENIVGLSLDLKETERYALLRDGLGANDSDSWVSRGAQFLAAAKKRSQAAQQDVATLNKELTVSTRRIDDARASLVADSVIAAAAARLRELVRSEAASDQLVGPVREWIARTGEEITSLQRMASNWEDIERERQRLPELVRIREAASSEVVAASKAVDALRRSDEASSSTHLAEQARDLIALANLGRSLGLQDGHCPLCHSDQDHDHYLKGIATAEEVAKKLDLNAAEEAQREQAVRVAETHLVAARQSLANAEAAFVSTQEAVQDFDALKKPRDSDDLQTLEEVSARSAQLRQELDAAQRDMRVLETLRLNAELELAKQEESDAKERLAAAQERAGRTRKAEAMAQALHDAARRAAGETFDRRLDRVLPLMSELYRRLRPHPFWRDIEYSIRGDVRKFLRLKVGNELNPQFLFSSGQRRATGLAFLLSVNLSLAWSRWRTIMLDDPVQHVDDFRTVHLAELAAQLVAEGRQIICAVEDAALAELLCRRLPVNGQDKAKRVRLGPDENGDLSVCSEQSLPMLAKNSFLAGRQSSQSAVGV
jgi:DNA repair exonuclease SbcCD ATPase subunit